MSYGLKYTVPFRTISEVDCVVNIEVKDYTGAVRELIGGATPFAIETDNGDLMTPIRSSSATLSVFGSDYLQDLYTSDPQGIRATLLKNNVVEWIGFVTQDTFSQNFSNPEFIYEIECVNAISTLKYKKFTKQTDLISFANLIKKAVTLSAGDYRNIYLTSAVTGKDGENIYAYANIAPANFFDELGESMTYYEILEEIAKYLGCTFTVFKDSVYLLDYLAVKKGINSYRQLKRIGSDTTFTDVVNEVTLLDVSSVQALGYRGTGATLSRIAGKNKAVVNCSLYEVKNIVPDFKDGFKKTWWEGESTLWYRKEYTGKEPPIHYLVTIPCTPKEYMSLFAYEYKNGKMIEVSQGGIITNEIYSTIAKTAYYTSDNKPNKLSFGEELIVRNYYTREQALNGALINKDCKILSIKSPNNIMTRGDLWFSISFDLKINVEDYRESSKDPAGYIVTEPVGETTKDWIRNIAVSFKIGNLYYTGSTWNPTPSVFTISVEYKKGDKVYGTYNTSKNTNDYTLGLSDLSGFVFKAPDFPIFGKCEFIVYAPDMPYVEEHARYTFMKNIKIAYQVQDLGKVYDAFENEKNGSDAVYENEITGGYVDKADEIDLKICTNPDGKLCLSSVIGGDKFIKEIKSLALNKTDIAENLLIHRVIDMYNSPRFQIDPTVANKVLPYSRLTDESLPGHSFLVAGGEEDVKMESVRLNLIEL